MSNETKTIEKRPAVNKGMNVPDDFTKMKEKASGAKDVLIKGQIVLPGTVKAMLSR